MRPMGRPRQRNKDLPPGLYKDAASGRYYLKAFNAESRERLGGKTSRALGAVTPTKARTEWAAVFACRDEETDDQGTFAEIIRRFLKEELPRERWDKKARKMVPVYAPRTQKEYQRQAAHWRARWGARKYAKTDAQAVLGDFLRPMHVTAFLRQGEAAGRATAANRDAACGSTMFRWANTAGLTEFNPFKGSQRNTETPRDALPDNALFLELWGCADAVLRSMIDLGYMVGTREGDLLRIMESDWSAAKGLKAIPAKAKAGQRRKKLLFTSTPDLVEVVEGARALKNAMLEREARRKRREKIASVYLFCNPKTGEPYTVGGFQSKMRRAKERLARKRLGAGANAEQIATLIRELDIHFHDNRAKAGKDAKARGEDATDFLGHNDDKTSRIYTDRGEITLSPNPRIRTA